MTVVKGAADVEIFNLEGLSEEEKENFINKTMEMATRLLTSAFYSVGLKTHMTCRVKIDTNDDEFEFSFKKVEKS